MLLRTFSISLVFLIFGVAQDFPSLDINRDDTRITVTNFAPGSQGARSVPRNPNCREGFNTAVFYGPVEGFVETISQDAKLLSSVVIIETPNPQEGEDNSEQDRVELFNANLTFGRPPCIETREDLDEPIRLEQGRTTIFGSSLILEPEENIGDMTGPIELNRAAQGDSPALSADADEMAFNFDTEISVLKGNITVTSEDRVSNADELEFDEANGVAIMRGNPARSTQGSDFVEGNVIKYFLNNNDVVVIGGISGEINVDLED